jgi:TRAP-type C4-dicarboxylate transport system permease small subunit
MRTIDRRNRREITAADIPHWVIANSLAAGLILSAFIHLAILQNWTCHLPCINKEEKNMCEE